MFNPNGLPEEVYIAQLQWAAAERYEQHVQRDPNSKNADCQDARSECEAAKQRVTDLKDKYSKVS